jgi:hypothetical protein
MAVVEMSNRELSRLGLTINLLGGGPGLQRLAFEDRLGETAVLRDAVASTSRNSAACSDARI